MPSWSDLQDELNGIEPENRGDHIADRLRQLAALIGERYDRNVLYYASSFLQKPQVPGLFTSINMEDINGFMAGVHGHDFSKGLLLVLHTPGGMAGVAARPGRRPGRCRVTASERFRSRSSAT